MVFKGLLAFCISLIFFVTIAASVLVFELLINRDTRAASAYTPNPVEANEVLDERLFQRLARTVPEHTVFAVLAVDEDATRTDTIIVGVFNSVTFGVDLISIPRDTYVVMPPHRLNFLAEQGIRTAQRSGVMKMGEVHHHSGPQFGRSFAIAQLEELLGITIHYNVLLDLEGFRYMVDAVGGVYFYVPHRMYYNDPLQNLVIDLHPGYQHLNGVKAEGLVRYRMPDRYRRISPGYARGDLQRIEVQQEFMMALFGQVIARQNLDLTAMMRVFVRHVSTNFAIADIPRYAIFLGRLDSDNFRTHSLPGTTRTIHGSSFFIADEETPAFVQNIFMGEDINE